MLDPPLRRVQALCYLGFAWCDFEAPRGWRNLSQLGERPNGEKLEGFFIPRPFTLPASQPVRLPGSCPVPEARHWLPRKPS